MFSALAQPAITLELCKQFCNAAEDVALQRASLIPEETVDIFVQLGWMEFRDGHFAVTTLGQMALVRARHQVDAASIAGNAPTRETSDRRRLATWGMSLA